MKKSIKIRYLLISVMTITVLLGSWIVATNLRIVPAVLLPSLDKISQTFIDLSRSG
ncbi:hypothetical protein [Enterococcus dongliensis]|nr:hypothetical protein [Enterococcus dongliensis]MDT2674149.1 hypothetical protein [Enterococcus dongliensis]